MAETEEWGLLLGDIFLSRRDLFPPILTYSGCTCILDGLHKGEKCKNPRGCKELDSKGSANAAPESAVRPVAPGALLKSKDAK